MQGKDLNLSAIESLSVKLDYISEDLKEIKQDLKDTKQYVGKELIDLKVKQQRCDNHWGLIGKGISAGGIGSALAYLITLFFPPKH